MGWNKDILRQNLREFAAGNSTRANAKGCYVDWSGNIQNEN